MHTKAVFGRAVCLSLGLSLTSYAPLVAAKSRPGRVAVSKAKKKILIGGFKGNKSSDARRALIAALQNDGGYDVGQTTLAKPGDSNKVFAGASGDASAVLVGTVKKSGLVVSVHNGADGALLQDVVIDGETPAKLDKNISDSAGLGLAEAIAHTQSGADASTGDPGAAPTGEDETPTAAAPAADEEPSAPAANPSQYADAHSPLELEGGLRAVHRSFAYRNTPAGTHPRTYTLPLGPAAFIGGTLYPVAFTSRGLASNFGLTAGYESNFATKSTYKRVNDAGRTVDSDLATSAQQYFVGLKARVPISVHELGVVLAYGQQTFRFNGDETAPILPDLLYKFVRVSAEGRFRLHALTVGFHVGTRFVSSTGGLERDFFPGHVKTQSIDAGLAGGYSLAKTLDVIAGVDLTRYAFDFPNGKNTAGSPVIAGGASDTYLSGFLGLRFSLPSHE